MKVLKHYVNGAWIDGERRGLLDVENPSTGATISQVPLATSAEVGRAVAAAAAAFPAWSQTPVSRRVKPLFKLVELLTKHEAELARILVEEMGKSIPDAHAEMKRAIENTEAACAMPILQQGDKLVGAAPEIDGEVLRLPIGVFGIIAPFNFPAMVPFWFIPYAIATGNTLVVKPSEMVPNTLVRVTELLEQCGLPKGVFNLVHGDKEAAEALMDHPQVSGISFVGSSRVGQLVAERCAKNGKRFQSMGSAKNHLVVMPDAKVDEVVRNMVTSCYGCAGQRCMASSAIVAVGEETHREVVRRFVAASKEMRVGNPLEPGKEDDPTLVGPVISAKALKSMHELIDAGVKEGATLALDGRGVKVKGGEGGHYLGPTVFTDVKPGMKIHQTEIFGPVVVILQAKDLDEALKIINEHPYGNGASIYTQNGYWARRFKVEVRAGMVGINVGIPAPVAYLPFGGTKLSLFSDIKAQGKETILFFTESKIVTERYWPER